MMVSPFSSTPVGVFATCSKCASMKPYRRAVKTSGWMPSESATFGSSPSRSSTESPDSAASGLGGAAGLPAAAGADPSDGEVPEPVVPGCWLA